MEPLITGLTLLRSHGAQTVQAATVTASFSEENGRWVGVCLELGTSSFADSLDAARSELLDAVLLQLSEMRRLGFEEEYLAERSVRLVTLRMDSETPGEWAPAGAGSR